MKIPKYWQVVAVDCAGNCVGIAASYDNPEAALQHQEYLKKREQIYDIQVEECGGFELKNKFIPDESL